MNNRWVSITKQGMVGRWLAAWAKLIDGLIGVLTLGIVCPSLGYNVALWLVLQEADKKKKVEQKCWEP